MTVAATVKTVYFGKYDRHLTVQLMGLASDTVAETDGIKVDVSTFTLKETPSDADRVAASVVIDRIEYNIQGFTAIQLEWDHTTDDLIALLPPNAGVIDWTLQGGRHDPQSAGGTGDVVLTTIGAVANATYDITLHCRLR